MQLTFNYEETTLTFNDKNAKVMPRPPPPNTPTLPWFFEHLQSTFIGIVNCLFVHVCVERTCSRSRRRAAKGDKRMVLVHTHGLFIT
jgi:hypothetical protein